MSPRVLFVSKPIAAPWNDGSKGLVRALAGNLSGVSPEILTVKGAPLPADLARAVPVPLYAASGRFSPALWDSARVARHLLFGRRREIWHFVMAPTPKTAAVGRVLCRLRRVAVVQTVASPPRHFRDPARYLFGDVVVVQSEWTRKQLADAAAESGSDFDVRVIQPPLPPFLAPTPEQTGRVRAELGLSLGQPLFVYPGDLEVSQGARVVADLASAVVAELPDAVFAFAHRHKSNRTPILEGRLRERLDPSRVRWVGETSNFHALLSAATAILFPVDDLWGKVDIPIALLEAMELGVPVLALAHGPLLDLAGGAELIRGQVPRPWSQALCQVVRDTEYRERLRAEGRAMVAARHAAAIVAGRYERIYEELVGRRSSPAKLGG